MENNSLSTPYPMQTSSNEKQPFPMNEIEPTSTLYPMPVPSYDAQPMASNETDPLNCPYPLRETQPIISNETQQASNPNSQLAPSYESQVKAVDQTPSNPVQNASPVVIQIGTVSPAFLSYSPQSAKW